MSGLRLFVIAYKPPDIWEVWPLRDIPSVLNRWDEFREGQVGCGALIHIGFGRPSVDEVRSLVLAFPERVLFTEAAKWAMPKSFETSELPVGKCGGDWSTRENAVYVATSGWGYSTSDSELEIDYQQPGDSIGVIPQGLSGWVSDLERDAPDLYSELKQLGALQEKAYRVLRYRLPEKIRDTIDALRFHYLKNRIDTRDLKSVLTIVPSWVLDSQISAIDLPVRVKRILGHLEIRSIREIGEIGSEKLLKQTGFGKKSYADLVEALIAVSSQGPLVLDSDAGLSVPKSVIEAANMFTLRENVEATLAGLPIRTAGILRARLGSDGGSHTLEQIGSKYQISRERVRQIVKRTVSRIMDSFYWDDLITIKTGTLLKNRTEPLYLEFLEIEDPWFRGFGSNLEYLRNVIETFGDGSLNVIEVAGRSVVTTTSHTNWDSLSQKMDISLQEAAKDRWSKKEVELLAESLVADIQVPELAPLLLSQFEEKLLYAINDDDEGPILVAYGQGLKQGTIAVLEEAEGPLHYQEIANRVGDLLGRPADPAQVHNVLPECGARLLGRGLWGLPVHLGLEDRFVSKVVAATEEIIRSANSGKQWHCDELIRELEARHAELAKHLNLHTLNTVLERSEILIPLGRMVWAERGADGIANCQRDRINLTEATIAVLEKSGEPMTAKQIREELGQHRSVPADLQIQAKGRLVLVSRGLWGLADRDMPLKSDDCSKILDTLERALSNRGEAFHVTEIEEGLRSEGLQIPFGTDEQMVYATARIDPRFRLWPGDFVGLADWSDSGRLTLKQAVNQVLSGMSEPQSRDEICAKVLKLLKRPDSNAMPAKIAAMLNKLGATYNSRTRLWSKPSK